MYECNDKMVSHPDHYQSETGLEVIDVIEAFTFDLTGIEAVDTGNALKYLCRWKKKNGLQDLKKAMWYLQNLIDHVEKLEEENKHINHDICFAEHIAKKENISSTWACKHCGLTYFIKESEDLVDICAAHMRDRHPSVCMKFNNDFELIDAVFVDKE